MYVFKEIDSTTSIESNVVRYAQNLTTSSTGMQSFRIVSGSISSSYWNSLNVLFYTSGSPLYLSESGFSSPSNNLSIAQLSGEQFLSKYHGYPSSSLFSIPSRYYGEKIKEATFVLIDKSNDSNVTLLDDGRGNVFPFDNTISHSNTAQTSSDNYVGNIFYDKGLIVVTETSSYSHTASTASISVGGTSAGVAGGGNHFFITGSDLTTSIKFISTGSTETDTSNVKFFESASTTAVTAQSASKKINEVFGGLHITSSVSASVIKLTNDANQLINRRPTNTNDDLPLVSGSGLFNTTLGFAGGVAAINYSDIGTNYDISFNSVHTITTHEYNVTVEPQEFNFTTNYSARAELSGSNNFLSLSTPYISADFTGSEWQPYITEINLYNTNLSYEPLIKAKLPRPIRKSDIISTRFKIKLDI
tara:strand:- start:540 stop:1793 length:1254 start_codon:yes stop_codon:yes gene_type:complete